MNITPTQITGNDDSARSMVPKPTSQNPPRWRAAQIPESMAMDTAVGSAIAWIVSVTGSARLMISHTGRD